jgi:hypothetical protein
MTSKYTHPSECTDHKEAIADRKAHAAAAKKREATQQALARVVWLEWYAPSRQN